MAPKPKKDLKLDAILSLWTDVSSTHELEEIYRKACQIAVDFLGADRSTFVLFDEALRDGTVRAEVVGSLPQGLDLPSALNMRIPLDGVPEEQALIKDGRALEYDIDQLQPGTFKDNLSALRVQSVLIVPVVWRDRILGSFSLDSVVYKRKFDEDARHLCDLLAAQIAVAIQNAKALAAERHRSDLLHKLEDYRDDLRRTDGNCGASPSRGRTGGGVMRLAFRGALHGRIGFSGFRSNDQLRPASGARKLPVAAFSQDPGDLRALVVAMPEGAAGVRLFAKGHTSGSLCPRAHVTRDRTRGCDQVVRRPRLPAGCSG